jgi:inward rectifier potassium channel
MAALQTQIHECLTIRTKYPTRGDLRSRRPIGLRQIRLGGRVITTQGIPREIIQDLFHFFMTVRWPQLFATFAGFFLVFDVLFGFIYHLVPGCIANLNPPGFAGAFFFSVETFATVGYGDMHPQTLYGHVVAMIEIFIGLMSLALMTGIMFARFSRPRARFMFSRHAVVRPIDGKLTLLIRSANQRQNVVQDATAQLRMLRNEVTVEGYEIRRVVDLQLVRSHHPVFSLGWTVMHVIDETSPLRFETTESLQSAEATLILSLSGTDENTGQVLMARAEYSSSDIRWNSSFHDILEGGDDGRLHIDYGKFHDVVPFEPLSSTARLEAGAGAEVGPRAPAKTG